MASRSTVVVVGGGLAGLSAALEASNKGASVVLLEKGQVGGNSSKATSGINGACTTAQQALHIQDSVESLASDTMRSGHNKSDSALVSVLANDSASALEWLRSFDLKLDVVSQCGGHSVPRTHRLAPAADGKAAPVGWTIVSKLRDALASRDNVKILTGCTVQSLLLTDLDGAKGVTGVAYTAPGASETTALEADAVILCTGGFGANTSMLEKYAPRCRYLPTTNGESADGSGIRLAMGAGAALAGMDQVQIHPTAFVDPAAPDARTKFLAPEALRASGAILLNAQGKRFVDELAPRDAVVAAIAPGDPVPPTNVFLVLNEAMVETFGRPSFNFYANVKKFFVRVSGAAGLAAHIGAGATADDIAATLSAYGHGTDPFGKTVFPGTFQAEEDLWVATITPAIHYCMGGVRINASAEVLAERELPEMALESDPVIRFHPIVGLFGAGEVTAGVHGGNRLAGNSLLECVVFGRLAGRRAAATHLVSEPAIFRDSFVKLRLRQSELLGTHTRLFTFDLPSCRHRTGMLVGQYIKIRWVDSDGKEVVRSYSPVSSPDEYGCLQLLIKCETNGHLSSYMGRMQPGDELEFSGLHGSLSVELLNATAVGLIAGGVGISPMIQILRHAVMHKSKAPITLMYGATTLEELVYFQELKELATSHPTFKVSFFLDSPPEGWTGEVGFINEAAVKRILPPPADGVRVVLCGPYPMCRSLKPVLQGACGYVGDMLFSFM